MWTGWVPPALSSARLLGRDTFISSATLPGEQDHPGFSVPPLFLLPSIHHVLPQGPM